MLRDTYRMFTLLLAQAQTAAPNSPAGLGLVNLFPFLLLGVACYYMMIRPQMRRQKEQARLMTSLKTGDRVVTASGIHGMITNVKDSTVIVKVADNVKIEMEKSAVTNITKTESAAA